MKKLFISIGLMFTIVFTTVTVFAATQYVCDMADFQLGTVNSGWAILEGNRDTSTDRLSNVGARKLQYGTTTTELGTIQRPSQYRATMVVKFRTNGVVKKTTNLEI